MLDQREFRVLLLAELAVRRGIATEAEVGTALERLLERRD